MERVPQPQPALNKIQKEATLADPILEKKEVRENHEGGVDVLPSITLPITPLPRDVVLTIRQRQIVTLLREGLIKNHEIPSAKELTERLPVTKDGIVMTEGTFKMYIRALREKLGLGLSLIQLALLETEWRIEKPSPPITLPLIQLTSSVHLSPKEKSLIETIQNHLIEKHNLPSQKELAHELKMTHGSYKTFIHILLLKTGLRSFAQLAFINMREANEKLEKVPSPKISIEKGFESEDGIVLPVVHIPVGVKLSPAEQKLINLLQESLTNGKMTGIMSHKNIAEQLNLSVWTINQRIKNTRDKIGLTDSSQLLFLDMMPKEKDDNSQSQTAKINFIDLPQGVKLTDREIKIIRNFRNQLLENGFINYSKAEKESDLNLSLVRGVVIDRLRKKSKTQSPLEIALIKITNI